MSYQLNGLIQASDFNTFIGNNGTVLSSTSQVNSVWGTGTNDYGYGQIFIPAVSANTVVNNEDWANLITRLQIITAHQGNTFPANITPPANNDKITFLSGITNLIANTNTNRLNAVAQGTSSTTTTRYTPSSWKNNLIFNHTISFESADKARYFFNAGGQLALNFTHASTVSRQDIMFNSLASSCGTVVISGAVNTKTSKIAGTTYTGVTKIGGSGTPTVLTTGAGFYNLNNNNTTIFKQNPQTTGLTLAAYYLSSSIEVTARVTGSTGLYGGVGSVINLTSIWTQSPGTLFIQPGNNTGPVDNSTTSLTIRYPSTLSGLANTWGTVSVVGTVVGN
jgi:hypothetical protein